jgi:hypothetical protein
MFLLLVNLGSCLNFKAYNVKSINEMDTYAFPQKKRKKKDICYSMAIISIICSKVPYDFKHNLCMCVHV